MTSKAHKFDSYESTKTLNTIFQHRSVRDYKNAAVSEDIVRLIVEAGQAASNYAHTMVTSVVRVKDEAKRAELAEIAHQGYVASASEFFVVCADFSRIKDLNPDAKLGTTDVFVTGAIDAGVFAQNMVLAAESLGLGAIYIGAIRHNLRRVDQLLALPDYVVPLFGICIGPCNAPQITRPRLPLEAVLSTDTFEKTTPEQAEAFNQEVKAFNLKVTGQERDWNSRVPFIFSDELNPDALSYYQSKGFLKDK